MQYIVYNINYFVGQESHNNIINNILVLNIKNLYHLQSLNDSVTTPLTFNVIKMNSALEEKKKNGIKRKCAQSTDYSEVI